jgi:two-component system chemotaxis response regulator CheY
LAEIRQFDAQARVIMLTALDQQAVMVEAMRLGAKDFLTKPVVPDRLIATIQRLLG